MARAALISTVCALSIAISGSLCLAQSRPLTQFDHTAWSQKVGAPSQIIALAQTKDGYLWLGTVNGLFRFDGSTFEAYRLPGGQQFPHRSIQCLTATADGGLWIGYSLGDTSFLKDGVLQTQIFKGNVHLGGGTVYSIVTRRDGSTWAATNDGAIRYTAGVWQDAEKDTPARVKASDSLFADNRGTLWMATEEFVYRWTPGGQHFEKTDISGGDTAIFTQDRDGNVWIAEKHGIHPIADAKGEMLRSPNIIRYGDTPNDFGFDSTGALWILGAHSGVSRFRQPTEALRLSAAAQLQAMEHIGSANGLTSEMALAFLEDHEGDLWAATSDGLDRFRPDALRPEPVPAQFDFISLASASDGTLFVGSRSEGLYKLVDGKLTKVDTGKQKTITSMYQAPDGKIWMGGHAELGYLQNGHYSPVALPDGLRSPQRDTQTMTSGPGGDLWLQVQTRLGIHYLHGDKWISLPNPQVKGGDLAVVLVEDEAHRVWAAHLRDRIVIYDGEKRTTITDQNGLTVGNVLALFPSTDGMWIGGEHGLNIMKSDHIIQLRFEGERRIEGISGITRATDGSMWLNSLTGILRIPADEVEQALKNPSHAMRYRLFDYLDGLSGKPPQIRPMPSILRGAGNTIWFTTTNGVVSIDTAHIYTNTLPPPVSIKSVLVDGAALDPGRTLTLTKGAKDLQIDYTALSLSIPERVYFRYKLNGYDRGWHDAGTRRQAFYSHLPPGHYTFHVIACNNDGLWNETGAAVPLYLPPTFLQSWYFKALVALLLLAVTWLIYLFRMRQETARMQARLQERLSERERIARELHDTLFQSVEGSLLHLNAITSRLAIENDARDQLRNAYEEVDRVMGQARNLVFDLRQPVDAQDIGSTIKLFAEEVGALSDTQVEVQIRGPYIELKPTAYNEVLKVIKECIWNAFRHARPQHIKVEIHSSSRVFEVSVTDDGVGIAPVILEAGGRDGHWGLPGIRERAAKLKAHLVIRNRETGGTEVVLRIKGEEAYRSGGGLFPWRWRGLWSGNGTS